MSENTTQTCLTELILTAVQRYLSRSLRWSTKSSIQGKPNMEVVSLQSGSNGNCIYVESNGVRLLFDAGISGRQAELRLAAHNRDITEVDALLISHDHRDHSRCMGIYQRKFGIPVHVTKKTLATVQAKDDLGRLDDISHYDVGSTIRFGEVSVETISTPHDATDGGRVSDRELREFCYTIHPNESFSVASDSDAAATTLNALEQCDDVVLVSNDVEQLLYAYLDLFFVSKSNDQTRSQIEYLASAELRKVIEVLHSAFISRNLDSLDPFIASQYQSSMSAWAESRWLYWLSASGQVPCESKYKRIWLVPVSEIGSVVPRGKVGYVGIGRAEDVQLDLPLAEKITVDSTAWTLHSNEGILLRAISAIQQVGRVALFHNFSRRLRKFAKANNVECEVLGSDPITL